MNTNQTIDGVPRKWLENYAGLLTEHFALKEAKEVRALLDAPAKCEICDGSGRFGMGLCECFDKPAAKLQGEPVAHTLKTVMQAYENAQALHLSGTSNFCAVMAKHLNKYTEQPAPVAVVLPDRNKIHISRPLRVSNERVITGEMAYELQIWQACIDEVCRLNSIDPRTPFEIEHDAQPGDEAAFRKWLDGGEK